MAGAVAPRTLIVTDDWSGYAALRKRGHDHHAIAECGDLEVAEEFLPITHLVFANLKARLIGIHHGVRAQRLQAWRGSSKAVKWASSETLSGVTIVEPPFMRLPRNSTFRRAPEATTFVRAIGLGLSAEPLDARGSRGVDGDPSGRTTTQCGSALLAPVRWAPRSRAA